MRTLSLPAFVLTMALLTGCQPGVKLPDGFVEVDDAERGLYEMRAISADGVVLALRNIKNEKNATLAFWSQAAGNQLIGEGYVLCDTADIKTAAGLPGRKMTYTAKRDGMEFTYVLAVFVKDGSVRVVEAGGKSEDVKKHIDSITKALRTVR